MQNTWSRSSLPTTKPSVTESSPYLLGKREISETCPSVEQEIKQEAKIDQEQPQHTFFHKLLETIQAQKQI
jgi:hypothetical protein